jgi:hypothetical protein
MMSFKFTLLCTPIATMPPKGSPSALILIADGTEEMELQVQRSLPMIPFTYR